ncbi:hypothetical protein Cgig2_003083 [Carnegiea gigantea]|uniref:Uncharacterized protein n=1 Tax=Carnegiea gigantea TaxID=171969 RepID=A0A9Q1KE37_9CARY|nr:hypothetical protein Cgig2_003083 [Carnegiea gigantea]
MERGDCSSQVNDAEPNSVEDLDQLVCYMKKVKQAGTRIIAESDPIDDEEMEDSESNPSQVPDTEVEETQPQSWQDRTSNPYGKIWSARMVPIALRHKLRLEGPSPSEHSIEDDPNGMGLGSMDVFLVDQGQMKYVVKKASTNGTVLKDKDSKIYTREKLWLELTNVANNITMPWLLVGDFNETKSLDERGHGGDEMRRRCNNFNNFIENNALLDFGFHSPKFTWVRGKSMTTRRSARLDQALCNSDWRCRFHEGSVKHLTYSHSYHCPLLVGTSGFRPLKQNPRPFRFMAAWVKYVDFEDILQHQWNTVYPLGLTWKHLATELS